MKTHFVLDNNNRNEDMGKRNEKKNKEEKDDENRKKLTPNAQHVQGPHQAHSRHNYQPKDSDI